MTAPREAVPSSGSQNVVWPMGKGGDLRAEVKPRGAVSPTEGFSVDKRSVSFASVTNLTYLMQGPRL